jgi:hypothetical protein
VTSRYKIIGTICLDPQPVPAAPATFAGSSLEQVLLSLAVTDALADRPSRSSRRGQLTRHAHELPAFVAADLDALAVELQTAWDELQTGAS